MKAARVQGEVFSTYPAVALGVTLPIPRDAETTERGLAMYQSTAEGIDFFCHACGIPISQARKLRVSGLWRTPTAGLGHSFGGLCLELSRDRLSYLGEASSGHQAEHQCDKLQDKGDPGHSRGHMMGRR